MGNEVQVQKTTGGLTFKVPAHLLAKIKARGGNISAGGVGGNALLIEGKRWVMRVGGEEKACTRPIIIQKDDGTYGPDPSGEREPAPTLNVIVIDQSARGRTYYPGSYVKGQGSAPACWSEDGRVPSAGVAEPKDKSCAECPMSQKGSAKNPEYPKMTACSSVKRLAVQVCSQRGVEWGIPPLSLKLAMSSIWDELDQTAMDDGWYAWDNYTKFLAANGCTRTNAVVTQMRFGSGTLNVQFKLISFAEEDDFDKTTAMADTDEVKKLLTIFGGEPAKPQGKPLPKDEEPPTVRPATPAEDAQHAAQEATRKMRAAEEAEAAKHAAAAAEAKAAADAKAERQRKVDEAKAALAALEADEGGFDDGPAAPVSMVEITKKVVADVGIYPDNQAQAEEKKRTRRSKVEMEAARAAEAAKVTVQAPPIETPVFHAAPPVVLPPPLEEVVTTASLGGPVEIPAALAAALPAWD